MADRSIAEALAEGAAALGASRKTARAAEALVEAGRISRPDLGERRVAAYVSDGATRVRARIHLAGDAVAARCSCGAHPDRPCAHAVALAVLLSGTAMPGEAPALASESLEARQVRRRQDRGRSGLFAVVAESDPDSAFGRYRVSSPSDRTYSVVIRAVDELHNGCSCADLRTNRVGTCKHIEAVLAWLDRGRRKARLRRARDSGPATSYLYIDAGSQSVRLRLKRRARVSRRVAERWFDAAGALTAPLAQVWTDLCADAEDAGVEVPQEVRALALRAIESAARERQWRAVETEVRRSGATQPGFVGQLYSYQVDGVAFLVSRGRALLADDMGLGKTAQTIAATARMVRAGQVARALIVCPASLKHQWEQEIARFTARGLRTTVVAGGRAQRAALYRAPSDVVIVNYELARSDRAIIAEQGFDLLVLDEAQRIKNWRTKTADAIKRIRTRYAFALTGTPLENRLDDLYSLMQVVDPHVLGPLWCFNRDFMSMDERGKPCGYRNLAELRARLAPHVLRRCKRDVLDQLPPVISTRRAVPLGTTQRDVHDDAQQAVAMLLARLKRRPLTPAEEKRLLQGFGRMRMACDAAELVGQPPPRGGSPKLVELAGLLDELCVEGGHKVVVFSEWERMQRLAADVARRLGIGFVRLHGGVPSARRGELIREFADDPACQVFFSTDAGGVGLNLQAASHVINLDLPWNPAVLAQRIARAHRLGQTGPVNVVLLVGKDCIEERMELTLASKRALFDAVVGDDVDTDELDRSTLASRVATLLESSYAASTGRRDAEPDSTDRAVQTVRDRLGPACVRVLETERGQLVAVVADGTGDAGPVDGAVQLPASAVAAVAALGAESPLAQATVKYEAPDGCDATALRRKAQHAAAERKLAAARALDDAGLAGESLPLLRDAMTLACRAAADPDPGDAPDALLAVVYGELTTRGVLGAADTHALTRASELARAFAGSATGVPDAIVRDLARDAAALVNRLGAQLDAVAPEVARPAA